MLSSKNLPIMPALCSKLAYYAGIMLDALACLLCLKLCRHNRRMLRTNTIFDTRDNSANANIKLTLSSGQTYSQSGIIKMVAHNFEDRMVCQVRSTFS